VTKSCFSFFCGFVATMGSPRLSIEVKGRIVGLHERRMIPYKITRKLNIPWSIVCTVLKKIQLCGTVVLPKSLGRPCKLHMQEKRQIGCLLVQNR
jgi:hypothetical protein